MGKEGGRSGEKEKGICCFEAREEGKAGALLFLSRLLFSSAEKKGTFLSRHRISPLLQEAKPSKLPWALTKKKPPHRMQQGQQNYLEDEKGKNLQWVRDSGWWSAFGENKFLGVKPPAASDGISRRQLKASWKKNLPVSFLYCNNPCSQPPVSGYESGAECVLIVFFVSTFPPHPSVRWHFLTTPPINFPWISPPPPPSPPAPH